MILRQTSQTLILLMAIVQGLPLAASSMESMLVNRLFGNGKADTALRKLGINTGACSYKNYMNSQTFTDASLMKCLSVAALDQLGHQDQQGLISTQLATPWGTKAPVVIRVRPVRLEEIGTYTDIDLSPQTRWLGPEASLLGRVSPQQLSLLAENIYTFEITLTFPQGLDIRPLISPPQRARSSLSLNALIFRQVLGPGTTALSRISIRSRTTKAGQFLRHEWQASSLPEDEFYALVQLYDQNREPCRRLRVSGSLTVLDRVSVVSYE